MTSIIRDEFLEQFECGQVLLFIGEHTARMQTGEHVYDCLAAKLSKRYQPDSGAQYRFHDIALMYEDLLGKQALVQFLRDELHSTGEEPQPIHHLIARLTNCIVMVTTCVDQWLERAFTLAGRPLEITVRDEDTAFEDDRRTRLYKLHGSIERLDRLVLTKDDVQTFLGDQGSISILLQGYLARKTILFIGYDLDDANFQALYSRVTMPLDAYVRRSYALFERPPAAPTAIWCKRNQIEIIETEPTAFLEELLSRLAIRARPAPSAPAARVLNTPARPYKQLDYYEARDTAIFFGRRSEARRLCALVDAHRLVLVYGASGAGKTSLLLAGAAPNLQQATPPYEPIYVRALEDPTEAIRREVSRRIGQARPAEDGKLVDVVAGATRALGRTLVIILDQFEEFFIRLSLRFREAFIADLGELYDARGVPVHLVFSLREDWLAAMGELEERIPEVFHNRLRVLPLAREQARQVITAPVEQFGIQYEPALIEQLLIDLTSAQDETVMPPQLQLVCSALYDSLDDGEHLITLAAYERLGGAHGVLGRYLNEQLARLKSEERAIAQSILAELVTSQGTKAVKTADELALALELAPEGAARVLEKLVRARLLRVLERDDRLVGYELAHEYIISEIALSDEARARKQVEELIKQEVENWRRFKTLLSTDKLALISPLRALLRLGEDGQELLLRSALEAGQDVDYWLTRVDDPARRAAALVSAGRGKQPDILDRAIEALLHILSDHPSIMNQGIPFLVELLADRQGEIRALAWSALLRANIAYPTLAGPLAEALTAVLADRDSPARLLAAEILEQVARINPAINAGVVEALVAQLDDESDVGHENMLDIAGRLIMLDPALATSRLADRLIDRLDDDGAALSQTRDDSPPGASIYNRAYFSAPESRPGGPYIPPRPYRNTRPRFIRAALVRTFGQFVAANPALAPYVAQTLARRLNAADQQVRAGAMEALAEIVSVIPQVTSQQTIEQLAEWISEADSAVASAVIEALGHMGSARPDLATLVAQVLIPFLNLKYERTPRSFLLVTRRSGAPEQVVIKALRWVADVRPDIELQLAQPLIKVLQTDDNDARLRAANDLLNLDLASDAVVRMILDQMIPNLADQERRDDVISLLESLVARHPQVSQEVADALTPYLSEQDKDFREQVMDLLFTVALTTSGVSSEVNARLVQFVTDQVAHNRDDHAPGEGVLYLIATSNTVLPEAVVSIAHLLNHREAQVREQAQAALAVSGFIDTTVAIQAVELIAQRLTSRDEEERVAAIRSLALLGITTPSCAASVFARLTQTFTDSKENVRDLGVWALHLILATHPAASSTALDSLAPFLSHRNSEIRSDTAGVLGRLAATLPSMVPSATSTLQQLLSDREDGVCASAVHSLGLLAAFHAPATSMLLDTFALLLDEPNGYLYSAAIESLRTIDTSDHALTEQTSALLFDHLSNRRSSSHADAVAALMDLALNYPVLAPRVIAALSRLLGGVETRLPYTGTLSKTNTIAQVLGKVIAADPATAHSFIEPLVGQAIAGVSSAAMALVRVVLAYPGTAGSIVERLCRELDRSDQAVKSSVVEGLGQIVAARPDTASRHLVEKLAHLLARRLEQDRRGDALFVLHTKGMHTIDSSTLIRALGNTLIAAPDLASPAVSDVLTRWLDGEKQIVYRNYNHPQFEPKIVAILRQIVVSPFIAAQVEQAFIRRLQDEDQGIRIATLETLAQLLAVQPALASPQIVAALVEVLRDWHRTVKNVRVSRPVTPTTLPPIAARILGQILQLQPALATPALLDVLERLLIHKDELVRAGTARVIETLADIAPMHAPRFLGLMERLLADQSFTVRDVAARVLERLVTISPELATSQTIEMLVLWRIGATDDLPAGAAGVHTSWLAHPANLPQVMCALMRHLIAHQQATYDGAARLLAQMAVAFPELAPPGLADILMRYAIVHDDQIASGAAAALAELIAVNPTLATPALAHKLTRPTAKSSSHRRLDTLPALGQIAMTVPSLAIAELVKVPLPLVVFDDSIDDRTMTALEQIAAAHPDLAGTITDLLVRRLVIKYDHNVDKRIIQALGGIVAAQPAAITPALIGVLFWRLIDDAKDVSAGTAGVLGKIAKQGHAMAAQVIERLGRLISAQANDITKLVIRTLGDIYTDQVLRSVAGASLAAAEDASLSEEPDAPVAVSTLVRVLLHRSELMPAIRATLHTLEQGNDPAARRWARSALQVITLIEQARTAGDNVLQQHALNDRLNSHLDTGLFMEDFAAALRREIDWLQDGSFYE